MNAQDQINAIRKSNIDPAMKAILLAQFQQQPVSAPAPVATPTEDFDFHRDVIVARAKKREAAGKPARVRDAKVQRQVARGLTPEQAAEIVDMRRSLGRMASRMAKANAR